MAVFRCKMCGGELEIAEGMTVCMCDYCGIKQTLPRLDDERKANLYDRANHFRRNSEFDKAESIYETILNEDGTDAEAYWSLVLCHYGIQYVEEPEKHRRVPTVNRTQFTSIYDDDNYKSAIRYADPSQRAIYEQEANTINEIQKGILAISQREDPFDVFICYKENDENGERTRDSVIANDLYYQLTQEGFKVFFSRITLEDKLGIKYEPYIFAALNSAKVMVVLGTKPEYFNAPWVKNEWSRYLTLVKQSGGKKMLVPAYRDMDAYDLPNEFSHLQAQDMSKLGFMQDLVRGIKKLTGKFETAGTSYVSGGAVAAAGAGAGGDKVANLLKRGFMALEDKDWVKATGFFDMVLNTNPESADAYFGLAMADFKCANNRLFDAFYISTPEDPERNRNLLRVRQFGKENQVKRLDELRSMRADRIAKDRLKQEEAEREAAERRKREEKERAHMQEINGRKKMISDLCGNYTALVNAKNQIARAQNLFENLKVTFSAANSKYKSRRGRLIVYHILLIVLFIVYSAVATSGGGDDLPPAAIPFLIGTMVLFYAVTVAGTLLMVKNVIGRIVCIVWPVPGYIFSIVAVFKKPRSEGSYKLNEAENNLVNARQAYGNLLAKFPQAQNNEESFVNYVHLMVKAKCDELKSLGAEAEAINCLNYEESTLLNCGLKGYLNN